MPIEEIRIGFVFPRLEALNYQVNVYCAIAACRPVITIEFDVGSTCLWVRV